MTQYAARRRGEAGFTLLEIMVAVVVFGFLMIGLAQGTHFGLQAWKDQSRSIAARDDLDATDRLLRSLITQMAPGYRIDPPNIVGLAHGFAFTTTLPEGAPAGISRYADVSLTVDRAHDLVLRWAAHLHAVRAAGRETVDSTVLLRGVARIDFAYWRQASSGGGWVHSWASHTPPALVRIRFVFVASGRPAARRSWPAIVVAPMRRPAG